MKRNWKENAMNKEMMSIALIEELDRVIDGYNASPDSLIQILHAAQGLHGYLREDVLLRVSKRLKIPLSKVYGVVTFYHFFSLVPKGKHEILCCMGTACYVKGMERILTRLEKELGVKPGQTTPDDMFTVQNVRCLGACGLAPAMMIDGDVHGKVTPDSIPRILRRYR